MTQEESRALWLKILTKYFQIVRGQTLSAEALMAIENLRESDAASLAAHIRRDLFLEEEPLSSKSLGSYHFDITHGKVINPQPKTLETLRAYVRELPVHPLCGTWVSYQFPLAHHQLALQNDLGATENFVATRIVWILIPKSTEVCRVVGFGSHNRQFRGEAKLRGQHIYLKADEVGSSHPVRMNFTLAITGETLQGYQILFVATRGQEMEPDSREAIWQRQTLDFERNDNLYPPCFFKNGADLPVEFQTKVLRGLSELTQVNGIIGDERAILPTNQNGDKEIASLRQNILEQETQRQKIEALAKNRQTALIGLAILMLCLSGFLMYKMREWSALRQDFHIPDLTERKWMQASLQQFVGVWTGLIGSPQARNEAELNNVVAKIVWEFTDSGKGYLKIRRWGSNLYFEGFAVMETPDVMSFHVWRAGSNDFPRHSMARLKPSGGNSEILSIAVSWTFGNRDVEEIGIREEFNQYCNDCRVVDYTVFDKEPAKHSELTLSNGHTLDTRYIALDSLPKEKRYLVDSSSFIRKHPF